MKKLKLWVLRAFGRLDNPDEFDGILFMAFFIILSFLATAFYIIFYA